MEKRAPTTKMLVFSIQVINYFEGEAFLYS
jgi:hypothetical protein